MNTESIVNDAVQKPQNWQVGDLIRWNGLQTPSIYLILSTNAHGILGIDQQSLIGTFKYQDLSLYFTHVRRTDLTYTFKGSKQALNDFHNGVFTPYFNQLPHEEDSA